MARSIGKGYRVGKGCWGGIIFFFSIMELAAAFFVLKKAEIAFLLFADSGGGEEGGVSDFPPFFCNNPVNQDGFLEFFIAC